MANIEKTSSHLCSEIVGTNVMHMFDDQQQDCWYSVVDLWALVAIHLDSACLICSSAMSKLCSTLLRPTSAVYDFVNAS